MAGAGTGSTLMLRIADGMRRMKAANAIGLSRPFGATQSEQPFQPNANPSSVGGVTQAQPPQPASVDVPVRDRMRAEAEAFLSGLSSVEIGGTGRGR